MDRVGCLLFRRLLDGEIRSWSVSDNDSFVRSLIDLRDSFDELVLGDEEF